MMKCSKPDFSKGNGMLPVIVQEEATGDVLMLAYMNSTAWEKTLETKKVHYWSRSRNKLWLKGETSGHIQVLKEAYLDCDCDTILVKVEQKGGAACHTGYKSCFYKKIEDGKITEIGAKVFDPEEVYGK
jgi:phosphoribosyl-AMP cyclohydrolase